ncbi:hypothetical protein FF32_14795 [Halomonas campaniensis]|nr:hypothetical protein FF32_14795 [Halomonas campaniensis]
METFINSGLNRKFYFYPDVEENEHGNVELIYSRSNLKLKKHTGKNSSLFQSWGIPYFLGETSVIPNEIFQNGCSINYFFRYLKNKSKGCILVSDLDKIHPDKIDNVKNKLYELCFSEENIGQNPYKKIPFFTTDFSKKSLVINDDFFELFLMRLKKKQVKNTDIKGVHEAYGCAVKDYRKIISKKIYCTSLLKKDMSEGKFKAIFFSIINKLLGLPKKKSEYLVVHEIVKKEFYYRKYRINLRDIEAIVSVIMRSDGELYWFDRDVRQAFKYK